MRESSPGIMPGTSNDCRSKQQRGGIFAASEEKLLLTSSSRAALYGFGFAKIPAFYSPGSTNAVSEEGIRCIPYSRNVLECPTFYMILL